MEALGFKRVLIVEDEPMIAMLLEDMIDEMGAEVAGVASSLDEAQCAALGSDVDVAVLDINLRGQMSYPAAQTLSDRGIPFIFVTGFARDANPADARACACATQTLLPGRHRIWAYARADGAEPGEAGCVVA